MVSYNNNYCHQNMQFYFNIEVILYLDTRTYFSYTCYGQLSTMADVAIPAIRFSQNNLARYQTGLHIRCK